jgi:hypothetical protein
LFHDSLLICFTTTAGQPSSDEKKISRQIVQNGFQPVLWADAKKKSGFIFDIEAKVPDSPFS